ncbi:MAG: MFS transporter [Gammaproteobacteria bacterium]|nr:MFS transporter [Gammaproteobacteria bacterium]
MNTKLMIVASYLGLSQGVMLTSLPMLIEGTELNVSQLAMVVAIGSGCFLIGNPFWGWLSDRWHSRSVLLIGLAGYMASHGWMGWALFQQNTDSQWLYQQLLAARVLYGLTCSGIYPVLQTWRIEHKEPQRKVTTTFVSAGINLGRGFGPIFALMLLWLSPAAPLAGLALIALPGLLLVLRLPQACRQKATTRNTTTIGIQKPLLVLLLAALLLTTLISSVQYALGFALRNWFDGDGLTASRWLGSILVTVAVLSATLQLKVLRHFSNLWPQAVPLALIAVMIACATLLLTEGLLWWALCCVLLGLAVATLVPAYLHASQQLSRNRGATAGYFGVSHTLGNSIGPLIAGSLILSGVKMVFVLTLVLGFAVAILLGGQRQQLLAKTFNL